MLPNQITNLINAHVALGRLRDFLAQPERDDGGGDKDAAPPLSPPGPAPGAAAAKAFAIGGGDDFGEPVISIQNGNFCWEAGKPPTLRGVNLDVARGQLIMVVGDVGSGKSSLLHALLGEMDVRSGLRFVRGTAAYTAQDPWIQNASLRANILMGALYDEDAYAETIAACALVTDLEALPAGDATEIGEKGVNLSGGQKHRVALARAVY
eukprot:154729-Chlamydomonas_euryale.AAC.1